MMRRFHITAVLLAASVTTAAAQGTISTQGFGYPAGGLSTRAASTGGSFAEFDYASPRNPSSLLGWGRGGMYFQYDPEFRSITAPGGTDRTTTARFPLAIAAMQFGSRVMAAFSSTTLLDRTWATRVRGGQRLGADSVGFLESLQATGAINDLRLGAAISVTESFSVGFGVHGFTGQNRMSIVRQFDDSLKYGTLARGLTIAYLGNGASMGATWRPNRLVALAASMRAGGTLDLRVGDTLLTSAHAPSRFGAAVRFDGLPGASLAANVEHTSWSRMGGLSSSALQAHDAWEFGAGAELSGPKMRGGFPSLIHLGYRQRDLPFSTISGAVTERTLATGVSLPLAGPRAIADLSLQRASRGSVSGVKEGAVILSLGFTIRP